MRLSYILSMMHDGQWFGFSDPKNQTYENLIILDNQYNKPTEQEIENKKLELENEIANKETKKASAKSKLLALGLTEEEIKLTFGI